MGKYIINDEVVDNRVIAIKNNKSLRKDKTLFQLHENIIQHHSFLISELDVGDWFGHIVHKGCNKDANVSDTFLELYGLMIEYGSIYNDICTIRLDIDYDTDTINFMDKYLQYMHHGSFFYNGYKYYSWHDTLLTQDLLYNNSGMKCINSLLMDLPNEKTKIMIKFILEKHQFIHVNEILTNQLRILLTRFGILVYPKNISARHGLTPQLYFVFLKDKEVFVYNDMIWTRIKKIKKNIDL